MAEAAKAGEQDQSMEEILQSIKRIIAEEGDTPAAAAPSAAPSFGSDVLELTDMMGEEPKPVDPLEAIMAIAPDAPPPPSPAPAAAPAPAPQVSKIESDKLMSDVAVEASAQALRHLASSRPAEDYKPVSAGASFRSGQTIEDLVLETLRPMLREWLDANLPQIVERKVQREIERVVASSR